jgi:integrase
MSHGEDYYVPIIEALYKSLKWPWDNRDKESPYIFTHDGIPYVRREDWLPKLSEKVKIKPFGFHSFRRAFIIGIMNTGKTSLNDVSLLFGHSSVNHTEFYLRSINTNLPSLAELLNEEANYPKDLP